MLSVVEQSPQRLVLRERPIAPWTSLIFLVPFILSIDSVALTCKREGAAGGTCFLEELRLLGEPQRYPGSFDPIPVKDLTGAQANNSGELVLERREGTPERLRRLPAGFTARQAAQQLNAFLQDPAARELRIEPALPFWLGLQPLTPVPFLAVLMFLFASALPVMTCIVDKQRERLTVRARYLFFIVREESFPLYQAAGLQSIAGSRNSRMEIVLASGERKRVSTLATMSPYAREKVIEHIQAFLGTRAQPASGTR